MIDTILPADGAESPILQFGTSRFLLAHADLFVSEALEERRAIGPITVVQTTDSSESAGRVAALSGRTPYPVRIRGIRGGQVIDKQVEGRAVARALSTGRNWIEVRRAALAARIILSNTGDKGFALDPLDTALTIQNRHIAPRSFPAKLAVLLLERSEVTPQAPISIFPCELVSRNGGRLRSIVEELARSLGFPVTFFSYLDERCSFANSLVDRIVSEPIAPVGAVAEPYALWAIERQDGLLLPCQHPAIVVTDNLSRYEDLKLFVLNLGHTVLAELWQKTGRSPTETVREIMADADVRSRLESIWRDEVVPVFAHEGLGYEAQLYADEVRERFLNPFLAHRLSDIASNHNEKKHRRILPIIQRNRASPRPILQPLLESTMSSAFV